MNYFSVTLAPLQANVPAADDDDLSDANLDDVWNRTDKLLVGLEGTDLAIDVEELVESLVVELD